MATLIDTHTHLYDEAFDQDRDSAIERALAAGVSTMLLPAIDSASLSRQEELAQAYPSLFREMIGLHPTSVKEDYQKELELVKQKLFNEPEHRYVAIGEIGLDYYWDRTFETEQIVALTQQIHWAKEVGLPIALHVRKAHNELFELLKKLNYTQYEGVMHCFGGSVQEARRALDMGLYIGIGGVVTFKNATMAEVAAAVPLERIVLETDAPYLAPVPMRGKRNESAYLTYIAEQIAKVRGISIETVMETTSQNAHKLFKL